MTYSELASFVQIVTAASSITSVLILIVFWIVNNIFKKQLDHIYAQSIEKIKLELLLSYTEKFEIIKADISKTKEENLKEVQKYLDVAFRDENARTSIISNTIIQADNERIRIYKKIYNLFFKVLYSHSSIIEEQDKNEQTKMIKDIYGEINDVRIDIFVNSLYLGKLIDYLLSAQIGLWEDIGSIQAKINGTWRGYNGEYSKSSDEIRKAEKWIVDNMKTYLTLNHIDLSEEIINQLHEGRIKIIKEKLDD